ncbi:CheR family methyltransferase [Rubrivivax benzoatilyticus]|uniref:Chemotaxis protein methyltransferase n=1 Tax=Rubrivivax benzoatilyticus TaxID=316997 RepID=A0ABX0I1S1_9BURK|nr:CheR family methyltransferase [Rubrivivax benzoatilyticus]EGJ11456.1 MCP methyltransferase, CheR-type [Rubrivivax benzoatilyticus JA2 = ATCC BAA-35]NHK99761.1 SAM-dependent methyltransferase [Rubrivivax benzoatilyticus]NHL25634.1 SAM-dependent methyltransferase [Rubrivivax benzoatilyticus]
MHDPAITEREFERFQRFIHEAAGIRLSPAKKALVSGRLSRRLREHALGSYDEYYRLLASGEQPGEVQTAIDLLTTNETYFFREPRHFELLDRLAREASAAARPLRVWSAASSSGEECYTIAMVLAEAMGSTPWEVLGTDISTRVLERARQGLYPLDRTDGIPPALLKRYCLRGTGKAEGLLLVSRALRERVRFAQVNLNRPLPAIGRFDIVFLRNVMIYFDAGTKRDIVARVLGQLEPGGHLMIGHSETLHGVSDAVRQVAPSTYVKR